MKIGGLLFACMHHSRTTAKETHCAHACEAHSNGLGLGSEAWCYDFWSSYGDTTSFISSLSKSLRYFLVEKNDLR